MQTPPIAPKRKYEVSIKVGADDWQAACMELHYLVEEIKAKGCGEDFESVSGHKSTNHIAIVHRTLEQTPEKYQKELEDYFSSVVSDPNG